MKASMEHWCGDTDRFNRNKSEGNKSQCHLATTYLLWTRALFFISVYRLIAEKSLLPLEIPVGEFLMGKYFLALDDRAESLSIICGVERNSEFMC